MKAPKKDRNIVGKIIREKRKELGLTQDELAKKMGYKNRVSICKVETGKEDLTTERVRHFAKVLQCKPAELMDWNIEVDNITDEEHRKESAERILSYTKLLSDAYKKAPKKDRKAVCAILEIPFTDVEKGLSEDNP